MALRNSESRFGIVAQGLHWVIALLIVFQYVTAELAEEAKAARRIDPSAALEQLVMMTRHKSFGIVILTLAVLRLVWRFFDAPPPWPATMPRWQVLFARATHGLFYVLLFATPLVGWFATSAEDRAVNFFGLFELPNLMAPNEDVAHDLEEIHELLFFSLVALAGLHIVAALKHQFVDKDGILMRMVPWRGG